MSTPSPRIIRFIINFSMVCLNLHLMGTVNQCDHYVDLDNSSNDSSCLPGPSENKYKKRMDMADCERDWAKKAKRNRRSKRKISLISINSDYAFMNMLNGQGEGQRRKVNFSHPLSRPFHLFSLAFNCYLMVKYVILCSFDLGYNENYIFLDCFLAGRFLTNGRSTIISRFIVAMISAINIIWRLRVFFSATRYSLNLFDFMTTDYKQIVADEMLETLQDQYNWKPVFTLEMNKSKQITPPLLLDDQDMVPQMKRRNLYKRPTRQSEAWLFLTKNLTSYFIYGMAFAFVIFLILTSVIQFPLYFSKRGFEVTHEHCTRWLAKSLRQPNSFGQLHKFAFDHIHRPSSINFTMGQELKAVWIEFDQWVDPNWYHCTKVLISFIETVYLSFEVFFILQSGLMVIVVSAREVSFYIGFLANQLRELQPVLEELELKSTLSSNLLELDQSELRRTIMLNPLNDQREVWLQAHRVQVLIIDLFRIVKSNNILVQHIILWYCYIWLCFSVLTTVLSIQSGSLISSARIECYIAHSFATSFCLLLFGSTSRVGHESRQLHNLIVTCMALDNQNLERKARWMYLSRFYYPIPLHSFTAFRSSEMSWMFALKLFAWLLSAIFISSTFYANYQ